MKLTGIKKEPKFWDRQACANCRLRSDAADKEGMKLVRGNRENGNLENTFMTIRRATSEDSDHRCKGSQILPFVLTNRHVKSSSWSDYKSLVKYITVSVTVLRAFCGV